MSPQTFMFPEIYAVAFVAIVMTAFLTMLGALAWLTYRDTPQGQRWLRERLGRRLAETRMWSMLEHRGVSPLVYVDQIAVDDLREQVRVCQHCAKHDWCDETLGYVGWRLRQYGFCPNRRSIDRFSPKPHA
jgi:hypothetical protein